MAIYLERCKSLRKTAFAAALALLLTGLMVLSGCTAPASAGQTGSLELSLGIAVGKTLLPTIDMTPASYVVSGLGPSAATFSTTTSQASVTVPALAFGSWTVSVNALNAAGTLIAQGSGAVAVVTGQQSTLSITVTPLQGTGSISLSVAWVASHVGTPSITAQLLPVTGAAIPLSFTLGSGTATYSSSAIPSGYYTLALQLLDSGVNVYGAVDVARIVKGQTTSGAFDFSKSNQPGGSISVAITPVMSNPLTVSITGQSATLAVGTNMTVTAAVPGYTGNVTYVWYLNGLTQATGSTANPSLTFGSTLAAGSYRLDAAAFTADGLRAGSANVTFQVQ